MYHCITIDQFEKPIISDIFGLAVTAPNRPILAGKVIANLFYEPSTRTSSSFHSASVRLGGTVIPINNVQYSSVSKGETLEDTIRTMSQYCDAIVLRHPEIGSSKLAATVSTVPIINAGDGSGEHPTQALLDLYTIAKQFDLVEKIAPETSQTWKTLKVGLMGDLKYGRTVHSLKKLLDKFDVQVFLISPESLMIPDEYRNGNETVTADINQFLPELDVLYVTRVQKERMHEADFHTEYQISPEMVDKMKSTAIIMHPLPRNQELPQSIDKNHRAVYFQQMKNGLEIRMALFEYIFEHVTN